MKLEYTERNKFVRRIIEYSTIATLVTGTVLFSTGVTTYKTMSIKTVAFIPHIIYNITGLKTMNPWHAQSELQLLWKD